ncbi:hypothetical protein Tco_0285708 [Tanacetum coccineum]
MYKAGPQDFQMVTYYCWLKANAARHNLLLPDERKGFANPTDPYHTPTITQPSTSQPQTTQKPRKPKRKNTQVPQPSGSSEHVANEAVHKELGDNLVRAATTASTLEAEKEIGNINKTQSKEIPNESSSLGTTSGGGPRCQETIGDTIAQTRFENVSKLSNDSQLARGNTLRSDEDSLKLKELMELCTNLQQRVLDLEKTKTTQQNESASLKRRVKKLEQKERSRTYRLKRLHKVGMSRRVVFSDNEESLGEDASKQGRIDADAEMFDVGTVIGDEVFAKQEVAAKDMNLTVDEVTLAQALAALKSVKSKVKEDVIEEPNIPVNAARASTKAEVQNKGKRKMIEPKPVKKMSKKDQLMSDEEEAKRLQTEFDEEERLAREKDEANEQEELSVEEKAKLFQQLLKQRRKHFAAKKDVDRSFKRVNTFVDFRTDLVEGSSKRAGEELEQESTKKQKVDEDKDTAKLQSLMKVIPDEEEVVINVVPLATKSPKIVDWKIYKEGKKSYYQIVRADGKSQMYMIFSQMLKSFDKEDLEDLYKLVKARYGSTRPVESMDYLLWNDLKTMFEPHVEDAIWRNQQGYKVLEWKLYDSIRSIEVGPMVLDSFDVEIDYGKARDGPYSRWFDEYKKVFNNKIEQLGNKYDLGIGKKGYALDDVWEICEKFHGTVYPWHDEGFEEEERWESGIEKKDYEPPFVYIETFKIKRYSFDGGRSFFCITKQLDDALPLGRENGSRFIGMIRKEMDDEGKVLTTRKWNSSFSSDFKGLRVCSGYVGQKFISCPYHSKLRAMLRGVSRSNFSLIL